jgi:hypothetical protein
MLLIELFDSGGRMTNRLRQAALEVITPLLGQKVPFITVQQIVDALRNENLGLVIDRALVMKLLDPNEVKAVAEIKGDRIYLAKPAPPDQEQNAEDEQKQKADVSKAAQQQAKKELAPQAAPTPPAPAPQ